VSTILKALRRLEQERSKGAEKPLREQVVLSRARRRGPWAVWLATGAALALGFAATWAVLNGYREPPAEPAAVSAPPAAVAAPPPASAVQPPRVAPTPAPAPPPAARVAAAVPLPAARAPGATAVAPPFEPREPIPSPRPAEPTPPRVAAAPPVAPRAREPEPGYADEAPVVTAPITGRAPRFVDDDEQPARSARSELPVSVVRTSWHPQAERRAAWVAIGGESPREVHEGEWVGAYEVRSIEPDGVLFADGPLLVHRPVGQP